MGLDVTAWSHLVPIAPRTRSGFCGAEDCDHARLSPTTGLPDQLIQDPGCYATTAESATLRFRAGSYTGYNDWRRLLSRLVYGVPPERVWANPRSYGTRAFVRLINFSDCEGSIGWAASADLAEEFKRSRPALADAVATWVSPGEATDWLQRYDLWWEAFTLGAQHGAVQLH